MSLKTVSILHYAGPPIIGGVESTIYHHARLLSEIGYSVQVLAGRGEKFLDLVEFIQIDLLDTRHPEILKVGSELSEGRVSSHFDLLKQKLLYQLTRVMANSQINIVHNAVTLHKNLPLTAALHELTENNVHLLAWCHDFAWLDNLYQKDLHPGYPWNLLATPWENTDYITVSEDQRSKLSELLNLPEMLIEIITPGVSYVEFLGISKEVQQIVDRLQLFDADPLILLPARITRRKNIEYAIQVLHHLQNNLPNARLLVTGPPGPHNPTNIDYLHQLQMLRSAYNLDEKVSFVYELGSLETPFLISDRQVAELYRIADILIFPSTREGFGIPVLEAALARIPVFASNIPQIQESANEYAHIFDPSENPHETAEAIYSWTQTSREYGLRKRVMNQFTWQAILQNKIVPLIEKVITHEQLS